MKKNQIAITLGIMCFILAISIAIQIRTINATNSTVSQSLTENGLRDEVLKWKEKYDNIYNELGRSEKRLAEVRSTATKKDTTSVKKQKELEENNIILGLTDVNGPGIEITIKDNNTAITDSKVGQILDMSKLVVHHSDLISIVNVLKSAKAEAISINGQRVVPTTAITCEGSVIKINGEKITSPFVIKAIGPVELFNGSLMMPGGYIYYMKQDGILVDVKKQDDVTIEKYGGVLSSKYISTER